MRFLFLALTLSSAAALAQTTGTGLQITIPNQTGDTLTVGGPGVDCGQQRTINWNLTTNSVLCSELNVWLTAASTCPDAPAASGDFVLQTVTQGNLATTRSGTPDFTLTELSGVGTAVTCGEGARTTTYQLCGAVKVSNSAFGDCSTTSVLKASALKVIYDTEAPGAPSVESVVPLDAALNVRVSGGSGSPSEYRVRVTRVSDGGGEVSRTQSADQNLFRVDGLENGVAYRVEAFALDQVGNESAASAAQEATPIPTSGFYKRYVDAGGVEDGGCSATGGGLAGGAVLAALGIWLSSRRNRS